MADKPPQDSFPDSVRQAIIDLLTALKRERFTGSAVLRLSFNEGGCTGAKPLKETSVIKK